jgi:flagellin
MALSINTNVAALSAQQQISKSNKAQANALKQMASGLLLNSASDNAAGLAIAERFRTQIIQGQTEVNNLQSGVNYAQTADGGLETQQDALQRIRELATQGANGTLSTDQRTAINTEAQQLLSEINDTAKNTQFNGQAMLKTNNTLDVGNGAGQVTVQASTTDAMGITGLDFSTAAGATAALDKLDTAINQVSDNRAGIGAQTNRLESAIAQRQVGIENATAAESMIRDADMARESITRALSQTKQQSGIFALVQSNINANSAMKLLRS